MVISLQIKSLAGFEKFIQTKVIQKQLKIKMIKKYLKKDIDIQRKEKKLFII